MSICMRGQSDQRTRLDQIKRVLVMVGYVDVVPDIVEQRGDFQNQAGFVIELMDELRLIEDLQGEFRDDRAVLLIEAVFLAEASRRFNDLTAVRTVFPDREFRR